MLGMPNARSTPPSSRPPGLRSRRHRSTPMPRVVLIRLVTCAKILGWTRKRTLRYLRKHDAVSQYGREWFVSRGQLRRAFPKIWDDVVAAAADAEDDD